MKFKNLHEKATSIAQQKLMALALQHKRGKLDSDKVTPAVEKLAKSMSEKELDDFASTKHKGLPNKVDEISYKKAMKSFQKAMGQGQDAEDAGDKETSDKKFNQAGKFGRYASKRYTSTRTSKKFKKEDNEISNRSAALKPQMYNDPVTGKKKVRMVPTKSNIVKINDPEDVKEAHDPKHVKMAIGVASDPRYKQGNYSGAVRSIEKIKKGLSKHPQVAAVLKKQNEALDAKDTDTVKDVLKALKGASKAHAKQAKQLKKDLQDSKDPGEYDNEGEMAKTQLKSILRDAEHMVKMFDDEENLPEWVQNKITKAQDYLQSAHSYMMGQDSEVKESVNEVGFQGTAATALRVGALGAVGGAAYAAKKARDRFDPVKVADARRKRDEKEAERQKAKDELNQRKQYRQKLRDMQRKQRERQASK